MQGSEVTLDDVSIHFQQVSETHSIENCTGKERFGKDLAISFGRKKEVGSTDLY